MLDDNDKMQQDLLATVYTLTQGDCQKTAKMADIGQQLGLDRNGTEDVAMGLVGDGLLEIKSLSGALALTPAGLEQAGGLSLSQSAGPDDAFERLEKDLPDYDLNPADRKDLEIDLATWKLQQQRSRALPGVRKTVISEIIGILKTVEGTDPVRELLSSLAKALDE